MSTSHNPSSPLRTNQVSASVHERLRTLHQVTAALCKVHHFDELCHRVVELGCRQLGFDRLGLWFHEPETDTLVGSFGVDEHGQVRDERGQRVVPRLASMREIMEGRVMVARDIALFNAQREPIAQGTLAAARVWDGSETLGWLFTDNLLRPQTLTEFDLELLALYASAVGHLVARHRLEANVRALAVEKARASLLHRFISALSHDFRTPLSIINSSLHTLQHSDDPQRRADKAQVVIVQTSLLEKYISDLMTISRLETLTGLERSPLNLNHLLDDVHARIQRVAQVKAIHLHFEPYPDDVLVLANHGDLLLACTHLAQNAIDYSPDHTHVTMRTYIRDDTAIFEVSDNGLGISEDELPRIFEHFYRVDAARSPLTGGTGLGLPITQRIIELHDGWIEVESALQKGSTFRMVLPQAA